MMKLATEGLPPYEVLLLRGFAGLVWGLPLVLALGYGQQLPLVFARRVLARNLREMVAILCYVVALANMPIADVLALGQITPLLVLLGASFLFGERIGGVRLALIGLGFLGAVMVAQPGVQGIDTLRCWRWATRCCARCATSAGVASPPECRGWWWRCRRSSWWCSGQGRCTLRWRTGVVPERRTGCCCLWVRGCS